MGQLEVLGLEQRLAALRDRVAWLEEENAALKREFFGDCLVFPAAFGLNRQEAMLLGCLMARKDPPCHDL